MMGSTSFTCQGRKAPVVKQDELNIAFFNDRVSRLRQVSTLTDYGQAPNPSNFLNRQLAQHSEIAAKEKAAASCYLQIENELTSGSLMTASKRRQGFTSQTLVK